VSEQPEQIRTGSRDDLRLEASRCLRVRFSESRCNHCCTVCPAEAVTLDDGLVIDSSRCSGCLLCTTVCPSGALEFSADFLACLAQLSKVPEPVLGCCRTKDRSNGWFPCLGGLSDEHLLLLTHRLSGTVTFNISLCNDCPNSAMLPLLRQRVAMLSRPGSGAGCGSITLADSPEQIRHREETVDRRSFFKSFRSSLFQTAAVVLSATSEETEKRSDYTSKRLPARRELLNRVLENSSLPAKESIQNRFFGRISITEACTACQGCVAICPTGALRSISDPPEGPPSFESARCTSCGLCGEFCLDKAIE
jgi:Pyruvate/2-oxoacid:ferredoxin oxidoreductase delta subunit